MGRGGGDLIYLSTANVCCKKALKGTLFLRLQLETPFYARDLAACGAKGVPSLISFFKTLSTAPAHRIERATFRSAVKRSTD